jgi:copper transport protein
MDFNEPIEVAFGAIRVFDTNGTRVDTGSVDYVEGDPTAVEAMLEPDLPDGTYTVTWRVISADAHVISEAFVFHVGAPGANPQGIAARVLAGEAGAAPLLGAVFGVVRAVGFASLLLLVGAVVFLLYVWHVVGLENAPDRFGRSWRRLLVIGWIGLFAATLVSLPLQAAQAAGTSIAGGFRAQALSSVAGTRFGTLMIARALLLVAGAIAWMWLRRRIDRKDPVFEAAAALFVLGLLACTALAGHAGSTPPVAVNVPVDALHLLAVGAWVGGLAVLVGAAFPSFRGAEPGPLGLIVSRYSDVAVVAVAVVVITGTWASFVEVKALSAFDTSYGWTLLTKIALFLPLVGLGAINNRWAKPKIENASDSSERERGFSVLRRLVAAEVVLAVVVVGVTAFLVNLPPARVAAGIDGPFITDVAFGDNELNVLVDPNKVGENEVHLTVSTPEGAAVEVREMRVLFTMPSESIGPIVGRGTKLAKGHFVVQGHQLSVGGRWTLEVIGRLDRFEEARVRVPVTVNS